MFIDIGNTNTKILSNTGKSTSIETKDFSIRYFLDHFKNDNDIVVASVVPGILAEIKEGLKALNKKYEIIDSNSKYSFNHSLKGVGVDRLLAVEGALTITKKTCVVVDAGTAITVDFVNLKNNEACLEGGIIIPGFTLGLKSLNNYTALLPEINVLTPRGFIGQNTNQAMLSGVCYTVVRGVEGLIDDVKNNLGANEFELFITGGDGQFFKDLANKDFIYVEDLIFKGMKNIAKGEVAE